MDTNPTTIATIIGAVLAAFGAGKGIEIYIGRKRAQNTNEVQPAAGPTDPGLGNTGKVPALDIVTETECRDRTKDLTESIGKQTGEIQVALKEQTQAITNLAVSVTRMEGKLETATAENDKKLAEHIAKYHRRSATGDYGKTGS